jgi:hypothetical protein
MDHEEIVGIAESDSLVGISLTLQISVHQLLVAGRASYIGPNRS